ncbi:MAG: glucose-1-phosphate adenylyltransferase subunit GlgD, partial [Clostridia bacterium]|nr:glucose-1-phosphate adenylyltransferase subunit GlgD [Clostridia bacterium]
PDGPLRTEAHRMEDVMGIIYTGENDASLRELTLSRAVAALPVIGRYRVIDFQVSCLVNSGARNVGVITQRNYHSLMDHLGSGKEWNLHSKKDGLFILPPFLTREHVGVYEGMLDALRANMGYLKRSRQEYAIVLNSHIVLNIDFNEMLSFHIDTGADVTMLYQPAGEKGPDDYRLCFNLDERNHVTKMEINPTKPRCTNEWLGAMVLRRETLIATVQQATSEGYHSFTHDVLQKGVNNGNLAVAGYRSPVHGWHIDSIQEYYRFNMAALDADIRAELFDPNRPIYTKVRDDMPTRYGERARVMHSLVADGGCIEGVVENSVIFRGVTVAKGATVRNSIIMQDAEIHEDAELDHCILDKQAVVNRAGKLIAPATYPIVINKNIAV